MLLQHDYRPKKWGEVRGNRAAVKALRTVLSGDEGKPYAYLVTGPPARQVRARPSHAHHHSSHHMEFEHLRVRLDLPIPFRPV